MLGFYAGELICVWKREMALTFFLMASTYLNVILKSESLGIKKII